MILRVFGVETEKFVILHSYFGYSLFIKLKSISVFKLCGVTGEESENRLKPADTPDDVKHFFLPAVFLRDE